MKVGLYRVSGGPFLGPRGGKYADPQHKIPWTDLSAHKLRIEGKGHEVAAGLIDRAIKRANDLCAHKPEVCKDNLGIERKDMPQIPGEHINEFLRGLHVKTHHTEEHVGNLKATQRELNAKKVSSMKHDLKHDPVFAKKVRAAVIVSSDNHILDGHHRWAALTLDDPANKMKVHKVDMPIRELLKEAHSFKHTEYKGLLAKFRMKLSKAAARGGKYIRRVPYRDAKGHQSYRYYYAESASAREAQAGEEVRLGKTIAKVLQVHPSGDVAMEIDGKHQTVTARQWSELVASHYGKRYYEWAEKRSQQTVNAVLRHVPRHLLQDLKGKTDRERLLELQQKVPEIHAKLERAFKRSGISPFRAQRMLGAVLERRGWSPEARASVVGNVIQHRVASYRQVIEASENLASYHRIEPKHVAAATELLTPKGERTVASDIARTAQSAESELAKISKLLAQADGDPVKGAQALAETLSAQAMQTIALLAQAFPGLRDKAVEPVRETLLKVPAAAPKRQPTREGSSGVVYVAGEGGKPQALKAQYKLVEAHEVTPSHDPTRNFQKHAGYPEGVQERAYHRDVAEQGKVLRNAQQLNAPFLVNTNPDAVNGPPMVNKEGIVLGGNSRAMSMQIVYDQHPEQAEKLRTYMADHAHEVGLRPEDVRAMKNPVLVRVVETPDKSQENMRLIVRQMNESFTQGMDPRTMQVAMGRRINDSTVQALADSMEPDEALSTFLASPRSKEFVSALFRAGVIDARNSNQYMVKGTRTLNEDGRTLVSRLLVGRTIGDADMLSSTRQRMMDNLARAVPFIAQAKGHGAGYDLSNDLRVSLDAYNDLMSKVDSKVLPPLDPKMGDRTFDRLMNYFEVLPGLGDTHPVVGNERAKALLETMIRKPGSVQFSNVFKSYAAKAQANPENQVSMYGPPDPLELLKESIASPTATAPAPERGLFAAFRMVGHSRKLHRRMKWNGLDVSIENRAGSVRHWTDEKTGEEGTTKMLYPYGYVRGSLGADGDHVDVFVGPNDAAKNVYVIDQLTRPDFKKFDEQKCMLGFNSAAAAKSAYLKHFDDDRFFGSMKSMTIEEFKRKVLGTTEKQPLVRSFTIKPLTAAGGECESQTTTKATRRDQGLLRDVHVAQDERIEKRETAHQARSSFRVISPRAAARDRI